MEQETAAGAVMSTTGKEAEQSVSWKDDRNFLRDLGCFTSSTEHQEAGHKACNIKLSRRHTITGFHEGGRMVRDSAPGKGRGWSTRSYVEVNEKLLLSLEPAMLGTVLGMDFQGLAVPPRLLGADRDEINQYVDSLSSQCRVLHGGFLLSCMKPPSLVEHIVKRQQELFLDCRQRGVSTRDAFCLMREHKHKVKYNWAELRVESIKANLRNKRGVGSDSFRAVLKSYIDAALPALHRFRVTRQGSGPADGPTACPGSGTGPGADPSPEAGPGADPSPGAGPAAAVVVGVEEACQDHAGRGSDGNPPQKGKEIEGDQGDPERRRLSTRNTNPKPKYHESESSDDSGDEIISEEEQAEPRNADPQTPSPRRRKRRISNLQDLEEELLEKGQEEGDAEPVVPTMSRKRTTARFNNYNPRTLLFDKGNFVRGGSTAQHDNRRGVAGFAQASTDPMDAQVEEELLEKGQEEGDAEPVVPTTSRKRTTARFNDYDPRTLLFDKGNFVHCGSTAQHDNRRGVAGFAQASTDPMDAQVEPQVCGPLCRMKSVDDLLWSILETGLENALRWVRHKRSQARDRLQR